MSPRGHPYTVQPDRAFWSRAVSDGFDPRSVVSTTGPLLRPDEKIVSAGSCFAANLVPYLEGAGLTYVRTEQMHPAFAQALADPFGPGRRSAFGGKVEREPLLRWITRRARPSGEPVRPSTTDNFGYANFSAAYGNIYTVRQLLQLLQRATGTFKPVESHWLGDGDIIDPFRPGLRYRARTLGEFEELTRQHLDCTRGAFAMADVMVLTLGLTEAWLSRADGAVFPACPGTVAGTFDATRHVFHDFSVSEIAADLDAFITGLRGFNAKCRFILTVSPVPLVATATDQHVLCASTHSKSVLRVAAREAVRRHDDVVYFPAYELVTGPQAPATFLAPDLRNVTPEAVEVVMSTLLAHCDTSAAPAERTTPEATVPSLLAAAVLDAECEEMMSAR